MSKIPVYPKSPTKFFVKGIDFEMEFVKDATGAIRKLVTIARGKFIFEWKKEH
jgi:hypothetical protein